ncbi:UDP-phosphate alpha-N-acetylglucosaminephosphotransferase [Acetobacter sp. TBRC 12305]|uniref:UDP-phosphate alpha-N-acetylglucosaminephosphotransferase n=1 Tax=Acetobacter garciniae TaxID=2817435 RepID=A0A939KLU2_9PROT|nr:UDP-phosphate alpha-N-acetylglucosaminephosphotransferase [Acetobacter garciniae]MBO1324593.1 UDP-phosphate alpha-N-acetylglucosaminephosphotransferase [Acetobacter garciniae]MBX0344282.1 UDP-phosphate alpha-N-acetylglucosaminephosphotransferase [Acetobacter garciniae]
MPFSLPAVAFFCLFCAALLSAALVRAMIRLAVLDHPGHRSAHVRPTPKGGGVGVMVAFLLVWPVLQATSGQAVFSLSTVMTGAALLLLCGVSWLDDVYQWPPSIKFAAQCAAAGLVVGGGLALDWPTPLGGTVFSVLWLVFICNAVNFMDGLNGLVAGCLLVAALALAGGATTLGVPGARGTALLLACCLAGFLPFNFPHARIFLGDVGSQGCGLLAGTAALYVARHTPLPSGWLFGPTVLAPLAYDVLFTLARRKLGGHSVVQAHRGHLYQVLHRSGVSASAISAMEWGFTAWGGIVACTVAHLPWQTGLLAATALVLPPQLAWTAYAIARTRRHPVGPW